MIVEQRDYHVFTGKLPELLRLYETEGIEIQKRYLGRLIGAFTTDVGAVSTYTHIWAYDDYAERDLPCAAEIIKRATSLAGRPIELWPMMCRYSG